jgi:hypothetical protein
MYIKLGNSYIPIGAVTFVEMTNTGTGRVEVGTLDGKVFTKTVTTTTYNELKEIMDENISYDLNGVGLEGNKD